MPDLTALEYAIDALDTKVQAASTALATTPASGDQAAVDKLTQHVQHLEDVLSSMTTTTPPPAVVPPAPGVPPVVPPPTGSSVASWTPPSS